MFEVGVLILLSDDISGISLSVSSLVFSESELILVLALLYLSNFLDWSINYYLSIFYISFVNFLRFFLRVA